MVLSYRAPARNANPIIINLWLSVFFWGWLLGVLPSFPAENQQDKHGECPPTFLELRVTHLVAIVFEGEVCPHRLKVPGVSMTLKNGVIT